MKSTNRNGWLSATLSSEWNSSEVDSDASELACVGSVDFYSETSSEDKRSYAVFSSFSTDSADPLNARMDSGVCRAPAAVDVHRANNNNNNNNKDAGSSELDATYVTVHQQDRREPQVSPMERDGKATENTDNVSCRARERVSCSEAEAEDEASSQHTEAPGASLKTDERSVSGESVDVQPSDQQPATKGNGNGAKQQKSKPETNVLSEILNFLDDANKNSPVNCHSAAINSETESNMGSGGGGGGGGGVAGGGGGGGYGLDTIGKLHGMSMTQLTEECLGMQILVQDKDAKLEAMERSLQHHRELLSRSTKTSQRELNLRLKAQKEEYEATIKRHVSFIRQLVEEKKSLADKCESLAVEMRHQTGRYESERRVNEERHASEIKRLRQVCTLTPRGSQLKKSSYILTKIPKKSPKIPRKSQNPIQKKPKNPKNIPKIPKKS